MSPSQPPPKGADTAQAGARETSPTRCNCPIPQPRGEWHADGCPLQTPMRIDREIDNIAEGVREYVTALGDGGPGKIEQAESELKLALAGFADAVRTSAVGESVPRRAKGADTAQAGGEG